MTSPRGQRADAAIHSAGGADRIAQLVRTDVDGRRLIIDSEPQPHAASESTARTITLASASPSILLAVRPPLPSQAPLRRASLYRKVLHGAMRVGSDIRRFLRGTASDS